MLSTSSIITERLIDDHIVATLDFNSHVISTFNMQYISN